MGGNTIVIVIWLAHTPITDCQISKSVKSVIKFSVYLDFLYSTLLGNLLWLCESVRESARKKRKRGKIQFWTSYYKFSNRPDYYRPTFFITITIIFHCCMGLGLQLGMAILPRPAWPVPPRFAPCGFFPPCKDGGAGMGWDFRPAPRGGAGMGLHFLDPPRPAPPHPRPVVLSY